MGKNQKPNYLPPLTSYFLPQVLFSIVASEKLCRFGKATKHSNKNNNKNQPNNSLEECKSSMVSPEANESWVTCGCKVSDKDVQNYHVVM